MKHKVYAVIINAIKSGKLKEPFPIQGFRNACPGLGLGTYNTFLYKHKKGNKGGYSELFEIVAPGKFRCLRPFKYGF